MAAGCPVISTACGGPSDIIAHGRTGRLVPADEKRLAGEISRLLDDPGERHAMARAACREVSRYAPETICGQFCAMFDALSKSAAPSLPREKTRV